MDRLDDDARVAPALVFLLMNKHQGVVARFNGFATHTESARQLCKNVMFDDHHPLAIYIEWTTLCLALECRPLSRVFMCRL